MLGFVREVEIKNAVGVGWNKYNRRVVGRRPQGDTVNRELNESICTVAVRAVRARQAECARSSVR